LYRRAAPAVRFHSAEASAPDSIGRRGAWLGELRRIAARLLVDAYAEALPGARPGLILVVQTLGDLANFNPRVLVLPPSVVVSPPLSVASDKASDNCRDDPKITSSP